LHKPLAQFLKFLKRNPQLPKNFEKERRANLASAVQRDGDGPTIGMVPPLVTSGLPGFGES
jgi:hypothetical protein